MRRGEGGDGDGLGGIGKREKNEKRNGKQQNFHGSDCYHLKLESNGKAWIQRFRG